MAEITLGKQFFVDIDGVGSVTYEVTALLDGGMVELTGPHGKQVVPALSLLPGHIGVGGATAPVAQLQPDPPAAIARLSEGKLANVLPSPVAEPTVKIYNPKFGDLEPPSL